jgi:transposase
LQDFYGEKDIEGIFHHEMSLSQINEDRFGHFLDSVYQANPRQIFADLSSRIFLKYGIHVKNINYDTTSLVMWGEYEHGSDGKTGSVQITFGHSKQKRPDKKQIKMGIGVADGVVVDAKVLSGNLDDKTYNQGNIEDSIETATRLKILKEDFYYIADSALFTEKSLELLHSKDGCKYITRVPDNYKLVTMLYDKEIDLNVATKVEFINRNKKISEYSIQEQLDEYKGYSLKTVLVYSKSLEAIKTEKINKQVAQEYKNLYEQSNKLGKTLYKSKEDALNATCTIDKKVKYHKITYCINEETINKPGRPSRIDPLKQKSNVYTVSIDIKTDSESVEKNIRRECMFVLATNDLHKSGSDILLEYKTQISVEKKFQQLKSPSFVHTLWLDKPERIEALCYILLIALMILSVMEYQVRKGLKEDEAIVIGPGNVKMKRPTLKAIVGIFEYMRTQRITGKDFVQRSLFKSLNDSRLKVLKYLGMSEKDMVWDE